jgi:hypothetical protein
MRHHAVIHSSTLSTLLSLTERSQQAYDPIDLSTDQNLWLKYNVAVTMPTGSQLKFEPKEGHYELGHLAFQDEPEIVWAKNRWGKAKMKLVDAEKVVAVKSGFSSRWD